MTCSAIRYADIELLPLHGYARRRVCQLRALGADAASMRTKHLPRAGAVELAVTPHENDAVGGVFVGRIRAVSGCRCGERLATLHDVNRKNLRPLLTRARIVNGAE